MDELKPASGNDDVVPAWMRYLEGLGLIGSDSLDQYTLRRLQERALHQDEQAAFNQHMASGENILSAPLPGANPEVPDLGTGMAGVVMAGAGSVLPPGIRGAGQPEQRAPEGRVYHGTKSTQPLRNRPGLHVGTAEQANVRAEIGSSLAGPGREGHPRVEMFEFNPKKTAKAEDILHQKAWIGNKLDSLRDYLTNAEMQEIIISGHPMAKLNRTLRLKGYDAIEYDNKFEGPGTSYEVLNLRRLGPPVKTEDLNVGTRKR